MKSPELIKISDNEYRISGEISYFLEGCKTVIVDGEMYSKATIENKTKDFDSEFEMPDKEWNGWIKFEITELWFLGIEKITVWDYQWKYKSQIQSMQHTVWSENYSFSIWGYLFDEGLLPKQIKGLYGGRGMHWQSLETSLFDFCEIRIPVFSYPGGNEVYIDISIKDFLEAKFNPNIKQLCGNRYAKYIPEIDKMKKGEYFTDDQKYTIAERLLTHQIQYIENAIQNKQRLIRSYL